MPALTRVVRPGDTLQIGDDIIVVEHASGQRARLRINSDRPVRHLTKPQAAKAETASAPRPLLTRSVPQSD
ncbi:hypothetical protein LJB71_08365 [Thermomonas sp. S9]|uniref:hypothetical protein n=1 Tax=Thermomonas sp. S9 TaxID=2885203 RepID=UPI00216ACCB9|nr:hypothetical protein [Thermomonas sp. S9]MCR6496229.1 hypothetical protein [Thermomonas sp. S9]